MGVYFNVGSGCDVSRLTVGIKVIRQLTEAARQDNWNVTADIIRRKCSNGIVAVLHGNDPERSLGFAINVGTISNVVYLVDRTDSAVKEAASAGG